MKNAMKLPLALLLFLVLLSACNDSLVDGSVIHSERTNPDRNFDERNHIEAAYKENEYQVLWKDFHFSETRPEVDFEKNAVIFAHTGENSCSKSIAKFLKRIDSLRSLLKRSNF